MGHHQRGRRVGCQRTERKNRRRTGERVAHSERHFNEGDCHRYLRHADRDLPVFPFRRVRQLVLCADRVTARRYHCVPVHNCCRQCDCHRRDQSRIRHDADDLDPGIHHPGSRRTERNGRHGVGTDYRRRGLYGAFNGRRFHHRLENRILDR